MKWEGDKKSRFTVAPGDKGPTIYAADADGTLHFSGADWKECLEIRCKRVSPGEWREAEKCEKCVRNCRVNLGSQEQAMRIAELIERRS